MFKSPRLFSILLITIVLLSACNFPQATQATEEPGPGAVFTAAAQTVEAQLTQGALINPPTAAPILPTSTLAPSSTPIPPTNTPIPIVPTPTVSCDLALFVKDVSIPDGTSFQPNESFEKIWRLKNIGSCTWTTSYQLVFDHGDQMDGVTPQSFPGTVGPGQEVDLKVLLKAPATPGTYRGYWRVRNAASVYIPVTEGYQGQSFYVDIKVVAPGSVEVYNFVSNYCSASWESGAGSLPCPGTDSDNRGFVLKINNPKLENGQTEDEAALWTHPEWVNDGVITGKFPSITVESGYHFRAIIGCLFDGSACDVNFQLNYTEGGGLHSLGSWHQTYDGATANLDVDLSALAGHTVKFILTVEANGPSGQDWAFWLQPRIMK
jgi:hypothetical protein